MIRIIRRNFQAGLVDRHTLDRLIKANEIIAFRRPDTWVFVDEGDVRREKSLYLGRDRRHGAFSPQFCM